MMSHGDSSFLTMIKSQRICHGIDIDIVELWRVLAKILILIASFIDKLSLAIESNH